MDWNLQDTSCWIRAETLLLYIFLFLLSFLINLKFLRKLFVCYSPVLEENVVEFLNFWARSIFCDKPKGCFRKCFAYFFQIFQHENLHYHSVHDVKQWSSDQTMPKVWQKTFEFARWRVLLSVKPGKSAVNGVN